MTDWIKKQAQTLTFWVATILGVGTFGVGYGVLLAQVMNANSKIDLVEHRLDVVSQRLDRLVDLHIKIDPGHPSWQDEGSEQGASK